MVGREGAGGQGPRGRGRVSFLGNMWVASPAAVGRRFLLLHGS